MSYSYSILVCIFLSFCSLGACVTTHAMFSKHMFARHIHMSIDACACSPWLPGCWALLALICCLKVVSSGLL